MKFTYQYKTKDGQQHSGVYAAASRTAVYDELKKKGIKPFNVTLAPGFLNWVASSGKRGAAIAVLSIALVALICYIASRPAPEPTDLSKSMPRHQIYGDPALMTEIERTGFATVFTHPGERLLARYAQPGYVNDALMRTVPRTNYVYLVSCLTNEVALSADDVREVSELKRIVNGMKDELRLYLADGIGTTELYSKRLEQRLKEELTIRGRIEAETKRSKDPNAVRSANASLRALGLRPIIRLGAEDADGEDEKDGKNRAAKADSES